MKIGIITLPPSFNYGNILQAWALQTVLERLGHEVDIVIARPRRYKLPLKKKPLVYAKRFFLKYILMNKNIIIEVDGGINNETIQLIKESTAIAVVGSYITNSEDYQEAINNLKN